MRSLLRGSLLLLATVFSVSLSAQDPVDYAALLPAPCELGTSGSRVQVSLEDLRDLVPRSSGHLLGGAELRLQVIQWTPHSQEPLRCHVRVDGCRPYGPVTQQCLDHP